MKNQKSSKRSQDSTTTLCHRLLQSPIKDYSYAKTFQRHLNDLQYLDPAKYRFNPTKADAYVEILQTFRHSKGAKAGQPLLLEDWQKASIGIAMGWEKLNANNRWVRRFNTLLFFMARKQGKSLLSAGLALTDSLIRSQKGAEIAMIATKADQAKLVWNEIDQMTRTHKDLKKYYHRANNTIYSKLDNGRIFPLGRDSKTLDGLNLSIIVADEVHAMASSELLDVCKSSQGAREQPLTIMISTAGFNLASPLIPELDHARQVLNGTIKDEDYFAFLAEPNPEDDPYSIDTLRKANPNLGVSVSEEFLLKEAQNAQQRPELRINYLTKYLNRFVNSSEEFISIEDWKACTLKEPYRTDNPKAILIGCDLSVNDDLTAIVTGFLDFEDNLYIETEVFLPEERIDELEKKFRAPLREWAKTGHLSTTHGSVIDYDEIYQNLAKKVQTYPEAEIYYDAFKFKSIKSALENKLGFSQAYPVNQGFLTLNEPLALMSTYIRTHRLRHLNNPVMNWCVSNTKVQRDSYGNMKIDKSDRYRKIDPVAALGNIFYGLIPKTKEEEGISEIVYI